MCSDAPFPMRPPLSFFSATSSGTEELVLLYVGTMAFKRYVRSLFLELLLPSLNGNAPRLV